MTQKYTNAKIYKIVSDSTNDIYIGSTTQALSARMSGHRRNYTRFLKDSTKQNFITSFKILEHGDAEIVLIESFPCNNKEELHKREYEVIKENNNSINKYMPTRTTKQYKEDHKEHYEKYFQEYNKNNQEQKQAYLKNYYIENKEKHNQATKEYYENNKEKIKVIQQEYQKEYSKIKYTCECGSHIKKKKNILMIKQKSI